MKQVALKHRQAEAIAALSGGIAHDYNNILIAIIGSVPLALTDWTTTRRFGVFLRKPRVLHSSPRI
ncbi:MAG: hypothetical protein ACOWWM_05860 [Desulfobacterales bacterium]